ncbi:hypothetical protein PG984_007864 [Apiospora sp. TS-2023a]
MALSFVTATHFDLSHSQSLSFPWRSSMSASVQPQQPLNRINPEVPHADFANDTVAHTLLGPTTAAHFPGGFLWGRMRRRRGTNEDHLGGPQHTFFDEVWSAPLGPSQGLAGREGRARDPARGDGQAGFDVAGLGGLEELGGEGLVALGGAHGSVLFKGVW